MKNTPEWLSQAIFYQIYPPSFYDSNNDGIGDIQGIIGKLDYIKWLGCNAIWLNPCFKSAFLDGGYDITDYYKVDPRYGKNSDLINLFKQAKKRDIRVLLDLVPGHTSIDHPWFRESCKSGRNKYSDWYIWNNDTICGSTVPRMINGFSDRNGCYLVNFFWSQPALNYGYAKPEMDWQQPIDAPGPRAVRSELKKNIRFWLDKGASGFRIDMASSLIKNDKGFKETKKLWQEVRQMLDTEYQEATIISEWGNSVDAIKCGFHADLLLPFCEDAVFRNFIGNRLLFDKSDEKYFGILDGIESINLETAVNSYQSVCDKTKSGGFICPNTASHDIARMADGRSRSQLELIYVWLLTTRGIPFIYYGDELGMKYLKLESKEGGYKRTGSRSPMQWDESRNCGFSKAVKKELYLPVDESRNRPTVSKQINSEKSLLNFVRGLIAVRSENPALSSAGRMEVLYCRHKKALVYLRQMKSNRIIVAINPYNWPTQAKFSVNSSISHHEVLLEKGVKFFIDGNDFTMDMKPRSFSVIKL